MSGKLGYGGSRHHGALVRNPRILREVTDD